MNQELHNTGVYQILNKINGKKYIGSTALAFNLRFNRHKHDLNHQKHDNPHLQAAWNKYGKNNFEFFILEQCTPEKCIEREQIYVDSLNPKCKYNIRLIASSNLGFKHTAKTKKKISQSNIGKHSSPGTGQWNIGIKRSEKFRQHCSWKARKENLSIETLEKMRLAQTGTNHPNWGKQLSSETKAKILESNPQKISIKQLDKRTLQPIFEWPSMSCAGRQFLDNGNKLCSIVSLISRACQDSRKSAYGFKWEYNK